MRLAKVWTPEADGEDAGKFCSAAKKPKIDELVGGEKSIKSGASSAGSSAVCAFLGIPKPAQSRASSKAASCAATECKGQVGLDSAGSRPGGRVATEWRKRVGLGSAEIRPGGRVAAEWRRQISKEGHDDIADLFLHVRGAHWRCPCGWVPNHEAPSPAVREAAQKHCRDCQGRPPPKLTSDERSHAAKTRPRQDENAALTAKSVARYHEWRQKLPASAGAFICEPYLDVIFRTTNGKAEYKCTKCSIQRSLAHYRGHPCNARLEPRAISHFLSLIGKPPDLIANLQGKWKQLNKATTSAAASRAERAKKNSYAVLRYRRKRDIIAPRRRYVWACARDGNTPLPFAEWRKLHQATVGVASL